MARDGDVELIDLIIGDGLIGGHLYSRMKNRSKLLTRKELDLSKDGWEIPECDTAYICAAVTDSRQCEEDKTGSYLVNVTNTIKLVEKIKGRVVFISSERVFDGSKPFRKVDDEVCPTTEYGRQKAEAEKALLGLGATVIRLSKVISWDVPLFEGWIEDLYKGFPIYPFRNMSMSPLPLRFACDMILRVKSPGLYQISALRDLSYDRIAYHIANRMEKDMKLVCPIESKDSHPYTTLECNIGGNIDIPNAWDTIYAWCTNRCRI